jgi:Xaa-Pro aminopeptidase
MPLEEKMVINLEAPVFMPGRGSVHAEVTYHIRDGGMVPLSGDGEPRPVWLGMP